MTRARDVADTQDNLGGAVAPFVAGKNKIINGDFLINQRNFSSSTASPAYGFDRFYNEYSGGTSTYSAQTFTAGTAPVAGYEGQNFARVVTTGQTGTCYDVFAQKIEDVRTFANQTITVSFWAKAASGTPKMSVGTTQTFGAGGSSFVLTLASSTSTITTSWARYSFTINVPSIAGKTIGAGSSLVVYPILSDNAVLGSTVGAQNNTFDIWGVQVEAGSVATAFQTATGTIAGELAACQRYYYRVNNDLNANAFFFGSGIGYSTTQVAYNVQLPVTMRTNPSSVDYSANLATSDTVNTQTITALAINQASPTNTILFATVGSGITQFRPYNIFSNGSIGTKYIGLNAEL